MTTSTSITSSLRICIWALGRWTLDYGHKVLITDATPSRFISGLSYQIQLLVELTIHIHIKYVAPYTCIGWEMSTDLVEICVYVYAFICIKSLNTLSKLEQADLLLVSARAELCDEVNLRLAADNLNYSWVPCRLFISQMAFMFQLIFKFASYASLYIVNACAN